MGPPYVTISWIGLTALSPLSALVLAWTIVYIHRKRTKSLLLVAIFYAQLLFQFLDFGFSTLILLKVDSWYMAQLTFVFNFLLIFKSLSVLSLHVEEFYKIKSPSNYILNVNSSLLKYHLLVLFLLSSMGGYAAPRSILPALAPLDEGDGVVVGIVVSFHSIIILLSLTFFVLKCTLRKRSLQTGLIIGTNSTTSSTNLFGVEGGSGRRERRGPSGVASVNIILNSAVLACIFSKFWLPDTWPVLSVILWSQMVESLLSLLVYWTATASGDEGRGNSSGIRKRSSNPTSSSGFDSIGNGSLCFNNGEFQYFAGGKENSSRRFNISREMNINNGGMDSSAYNTFDNFNQGNSYRDSSRAGSVTTMANDDFEFLPGEPVPPRLGRFSGDKTYCYENKILDQPGTGPRSNGTLEKGTTAVASSLSLNDLDLVGRGSSCSESTGGTDSQPMKSKYRKNRNTNYRKSNSRRFGNRSLSRRVLSLESLHSNLQDSPYPAYLDTGERVIVVTTDFI